MKPTQIASLAVVASLALSTQAQPSGDANWVSLGGVNGADAPVSAVAADGLGNLYIGSDFAVVGGVTANGIAKWNGSAWSALGSGISGFVFALAVSGSDLYAGGDFTTATNNGDVPVTGQLNCQMGRQRLDRAGLGNARIQ